MVDESRFEAASRAYDAGDWRSAAQGFLASIVADDPGNAKAYCRAGNALMKMRRWTDAVVVYRHAVQDPEFASQGNVWGNLGSALFESGEYDEAVKAFDIALTDPSYDRRYRASRDEPAPSCAWGARMRPRRLIAKPRPTRRTPTQGARSNNLGLTYLNLQRPEEAVQAFRAALEVPGYDGRGNALANLGVAYMRLGFVDRAAEVFAEAEAAGFVLPPALLAVRRRADDLPPSGETFVGEAAPVEISTTTDDVTSTLTARGAAMTTGGAAIVDDLQDAQNDTGFFEIDEAQMKELDRERRKEERAEPGSRRKVLSWIAAAVLVVALIAGAFAAALLTGFGWPTQTDTTNGVLNAYKAGQPVDQYWVAVPQTDIDKAMAKIPPTFSSAKVTLVKNTSPFAARASVTVAIPNGSPLDYVIVLQREGVGWRVQGIENDWSFDDRLAVAATSRPRRPKEAWTRRPT